MSSNCEENKLYLDSLLKNMKNYCKSCDMLKSLEKYRKAYYNFMFDHLTEVPYSQHFYRYYKKELLENYLKKGGLIILADVDNLKKVNKKGYGFGDLYLKRATYKLLDNLNSILNVNLYFDFEKNRLNYLIARRGGDEFIVLFYQMN